MNIQLVSSELNTINVDVLAVGVLEGALEKQKALRPLDDAFEGALLAQAARMEFTGKAEQVLDLPSLGRVPAKRVLLIGLGSKREVTPTALRTYAALAARIASSGTNKSLALLVPEAPAKPALREIGEGIGLGAYRFTKYLTGERVPKGELVEVQLVRLGARANAADKKALELGLAIAAAVNLARDAVNEPPNVLTPEALAQVAQGIAKKGKLKITVLDKKGIAEKGMKLHYAVGQGSANEPRFVHLTYAPKRAKRKIVFVGKGLTFDSGGLCIKPAPGMGEMKSDMGGAAAVLGLMAAVTALEPAVEVHGIIGAAENMPDGAAYRPGDVFGSLDGKTVEIINTDAEGRLVLADALTYARRLEPDLIVDAATLTGACIVALGKTCTGFFATADGLAREIERAAREAGEQVWRLPLLEDQREQLKSDVADLKHTGERWGGAITAALFLREFVGKVPWVHLDIAGPALADRAQGVIPKGGTGHAVLTFLKLVEAS
jgi:leucyl aminopeptidase